MEPTPTDVPRDDRPYEPPALTVLGTIADLTRAKMGGMGDRGSTST